VQASAFSQLSALLLLVSWRELPTYSKIPFDRYRLTTPRFSVWNILSLLAFVTSPAYPLGIIIYAMSDTYDEDVCIILHLCQKDTLMTIAFLWVL
jgi:hypothetical protein